MSAPTTKQRHALPSWVIRYQNTVGLGILMVALMGINGVVYGSGVVADIERPDTWGIFGTMLFALFFLAGTVMPGLALRFGEHIFHGSFSRRFWATFFTLVFFVVEVWASVTERSLNTITTPADRWLLQVIHAPTLPFSPTVLAIALTLSIAVVGWGVIATPVEVEDAETLEAKMQRKLMVAQYNGQINAARAAGGRAVVLAARGKSDNAQPLPTMPIASAAPLDLPTNDIPTVDDGGESSEPIHLVQVPMSNVVEGSLSYGTVVPRSQPITRVG